MIFSLCKIKLVVTVLTVYGIETIREAAATAVAESKKVVTVLTVYGIETQH